MKAFLLLVTLCGVVICTGFETKSRQKFISTGAEGDSQRAKGANELNKPLNHAQFFRKVLERKHKYIKYLSGTIAGAKVHMALYFEPASRNNDSILNTFQQMYNVFGYYYYENQNIPLTLSGIFNHQTKQLNLTERNLVEKDLYFDIFGRQSESDLIFKGQFTQTSYSGTLLNEEEESRDFNLKLDNSHNWLSLWRIKDHGVIYVFDEKGNPKASDEWDGSGMASSVYKQVHFILINDLVYLHTENNQLTHSWSGAPACITQPINITGAKTLDLYFTYEDGEHCKISYTISSNSLKATEAKNSACFTQKNSIRNPEWPIRIYPGYGGTYYPLP